jgi:hypothetical protein
MYRDNHRSRILATILAVIAAVTLAVTCADARTIREKTPTSNASFGPIKQIDAALLNVGYVEAGPTDGTAVILLHGWPYDIYSYVDVAPCWQRPAIT